MSCYFIANINVHDPETYQKYLDGFDEIFGKYKGIVVTADENPTVLEGTWPYTRSVLITFPDESEARRWFESAEYQELAKFRHASAKSDIILVERKKSR